MSRLRKSQPRPINAKTATRLSKTICIYAPVSDSQWNLFQLCQLYIHVTTRHCAGSTCVCRNPAVFGSDRVQPLLVNDTLKGRQAANSGPDLGGEPPCLDIAQLPLLPPLQRWLH
jgi:hypothetical protein